MPSITIELYKGILLGSRVHEYPDADLVAFYIPFVCLWLEFPKHNEEEDIYL